MLASHSLALMTSTHKRMLLSQLIDEYLSSINLEESHIKRYELNDFMKFTSDKLISDITIHDIQNYISFKQSRNLKSTTIYKYLCILRVLFNYAISHKYIKENPCEGILVNYKSKKNTHTIDYSKKYIRKILELFKNTNLYYVVLIALHTRYA